MSSRDSSDHPPDCSPSFGCSWRREGVDAASVQVWGELDIATSPRLDQTLDEAQQGARLVLLNMREVSFVDCSGVHVIVDASERARQMGGRLVVVEPPRQARKMFVLTGTHVDVELLRIDSSPLVGRDHTDRSEMPRGWTASGQQRRSGRDRRLHPLENPVNARVVAARVMAVADRGLWLHDADGALHRAWSPETAGLPVPAGTIEVYLDGRGGVNGWMDPESGLAINQRRLNRAADPATAQALACQGTCGVVWQAPAADQLTKHDERCLTCAGPLLLR